MNNLPGQKLYTFHCIYLKHEQHFIHCLAGLTNQQQKVRRVLDLTPEQKKPPPFGLVPSLSHLIGPEVPPLLLQMVLVKIAMSTSLFWLPHSESGSSPENGNRAETELNKVRVMAMAAGDAMSNEMLRVYRFALGALWLGRSGHSGHLILLRALPNLWALWHSIGFLRFHATFQDSRMLWRYLVAPGILAFDWHLEH
ncbi:hypothetical protein H4Q26_015003 [Puccinia striiformis f. sp. tritici PST-130]|nr:hypothetical protein Pst134EB_014161 [Puccinia striiformis f. sp. tritici]KAI9622721.1 hypothetical protein H4Q26_015003 [Puccinia striiformis f. sp. tritici PST-130]